MGLLEKGVTVSYKIEVALNKVILKPCPLVLEGTWLGGLVGGVLGALLVVTILTCALINIMRCWFKRKAKTGLFPKAYSVCHIITVYWIFR